MLRSTLFAITLVLAGIALFGIAGCYGPSPGLDPVVKVTLPKDDMWPNFPLGSNLQLVGEPKTSDDSANKIVESYWAQTAGPRGAFSIESINSPMNVWQAPEALAPGESDVVTLALKTKTLLGGSNTTSVTFTLVPRSSLPQYHFDPGTPSAVTEGEHVIITGIVRDIDMNDISDDVTYSWTQVPGDDTGGYFWSTTVRSPEWTAPACPRVTDQYGNIIGIPVTYKLRVTTKTQAGVSNTNNWIIVVQPEGVLP